MLVVQGDAVTDVDFSALMAAHVAEDALLTIGCQQVDEQDVPQFGIVVTDASAADGASGNILGFQEKPARHEAKSRLASTGFYILSPPAYPLIASIYAGIYAETVYAARRRAQVPLPDEVSLDFANDIFPALLRHVATHPESGKCWAQRVEGYWSDIGNPAQYLQSLHDVYAGKVNLPLPDCPERFYRNGILYWEGTQEIADRENALLEGNIVVARPIP